LFAVAGLACSIGAVQAGTALASTGSACVLTNAQASSVLGSSAAHGKPTSVPAAHEAMCNYLTSGGSAGIGITASPASGYPSTALLKTMMAGASVMTLHGIGDRAELVKPKTPGVVNLYFAAGKRYYALTLSMGHSKVTSKEISRLESVSKAAAKKL
jgi:hypothetical protein